MSGAELEGPPGSFGGEEGVAFLDEPARGDEGVGGGPEGGGALQGVGDWPDHEAWWGVSDENGVGGACDGESRGGMYIYLR